MKNNTIVEVDKRGPVHEFDLIGSCSESESEISSGSSLESDSFEEVTSTASSSSSSADQLASDPLSDMSALFQQLPIKRGLSKYYQGKAQSFTSLANVSCLEDLAKPEKPYNKKLKSCRSYGGGMGETHNRTKCTPMNVYKRGLHSGGSRGSDNFMVRPPIPSHGSTTIPNQTTLFV